MPTSLSPGDVRAFFVCARNGRVSHDGGFVGRDPARGPAHSPAMAKRWHADGCMGIFIYLGIYMHHIKPYDGVHFAYTLDTIPHV